jgi:hypothetical protein
MKLTKQKQGKKNRQQGKAFEIKVRKDLEKRNWIVSKWCNNLQATQVDYCMIPAKPQYNPFFKRIVGEGSGFPDFIVYRLNVTDYSVWGVECKINGKLDKIEKAKCEWLIQNKIFHKIWIAQKGLKRGDILYTQWKL